MRDKIKERLEKLQDTQQKDLQQLQQIENALQRLQQNITIRSGRIAELKELLKD